MADFFRRQCWPSLTSIMMRSAGFPPTVDHANFLDDVDKNHFSWMVFIVAASGFLTDSYNLFASNIILPALDFVYWQSGAPATNGNPILPLAFNLTTLLASAVGQIVFGLAADMYGRKALYGIELVIVIISTIGLLQCSQGYISPLDPQDHTWDFTAWLLFWRAIMGFAIGAEYPLSACIASEWSSTQSRGRMMSAVFLMQPIGQLCAYGAGLTALNLFQGDTKIAIDKFWRYVIAIGVIPTLIAILFRLFMPESGRYEFDVIRSRHTSSSRSAANGSIDRNASRPRSDRVAVGKGIWRQFQRNEIANYFRADKQRWRTFLGTCAVWFLLDIAFYGLGFNSPGTLSKVWAGHSLQFPSQGSAPWWLYNSDVQTQNFTVTVWEHGSLRNKHLNITDAFPTNVFATPLIRSVLRQNILHAIYTVSISSIFGSILIIALINRIFRKDMLIYTFTILSVLLFAAFGSFAILMDQNSTHDVLIFFWCAISFVFSFGPNTLIFMLPAEVFPTEYRCTFYGVAAASGKLGSALAQGMVYIVDKYSKPKANSSNLRWLLLGFAICMSLGAIIAIFLPNVQKRDGSRATHIDNFPLEYLALTERQKDYARANVRTKEDLIRARSFREDVRDATADSTGIDGVNGVLMRDVSHTRERREV